MAEQCVDSVDFQVVSGVLRQRTHAAKMLNDVQIREIPSDLADNDPSQPDSYMWTVPGMDTLDYQYGDAVVAEPANARFIVSSAQGGIFHVSAGYGDNLFATNAGASLYLTVFVGGASVLRGPSVQKISGRKAWATISGDIEAPAGSTIRLAYSVDLPLPGRANHFLYPDNRNFFAIHRIGGLHN